MIRILIADRQEFFRIGLTIALERNMEWKVAAEAATSQDALELAYSLRPDVAIVDLSLTEPSGLTLTQDLHSAFPDLKLVAVSAYATPSVGRQAQLAGARALLAPNESAIRFSAAVDSVLAQQPFFFPGPLTVTTARESETVPVQYLLSDRQLEVLRLLATGYSNKQIAVSLGLSTRTAESHISRIMGRLRTSSRVELVKLAVRDSIV
jgi:DNA-binding NarL/FixJ family response regulator